MKRKWLFPFSLAFACFVLTATSWAGGIVQEFRVSAEAKVGSSSHAMTATQKPYHELKSPTQTVKNKVAPRLPNTFKVRYDKLSNAMILQWKPLNHNGTPAIQYNIYRWTLSDTKIKTLATVDGQIYQYIDMNFDTSQTYFYKVVGIFNNNPDGISTSRQFPVQQLNPSQSVESISVPSPPEQPTEPPQGLGCSINTGTPGHSLGGLFFLMFLLVLPFFRRTR